MGVPSSSEKYPFLRMPAVSHDLVFLRGELNIELVSHDTGSFDGRSFFRHLGGSQIAMLSTDPETDAHSLESALSFQGIAESRFVLESPLPNCSLVVSLVATPSLTTLPTLDTTGIACMAFFSTNPQKDGERLVASGARATTREFAVRVADRDLRVVIARLAGGALVELFAPKGNTK